MESDLEMYHQPLIICRHTSASSKECRYTLRNEHLKTLLDNEWIYLMVMDPLNGNKIHHYQQNLNQLGLSKVQQCN
jgi:uncharacterized protein YbcC (UPF0753/DUF2309 family)